MPDKLLRGLVEWWVRNETVVFDEQFQEKCNFVHRVWALVLLGLICRIFHAVFEMVRSHIAHGDERGSVGKRAVVIAR